MNFIAKLTLQLLEQNFTIHRLPAQSKVPQQVFDAPIYFIAKTNAELSIVLPENITITSDEKETDWCAFEVVGPLDFSLTGILSEIAAVLADEKISIFAISTFDTDYILVKRANINTAISALISNQYHVIHNEIN